MIDHDTLVRRVNDAMDDILQGEYGPQDVDDTGVVVDESKDPDTGVVTYAVMLRCEDGSLASCLWTSHELSRAMAVAHEVRETINQWLDNDIARQNQ